MEVIISPIALVAAGAFSLPPILGELNLLWQNLPDIRKYFEPTVSGSNPHSKAVVSQGGAERRYSDHGRLFAGGLADLRHHQPHCRHPLHGSRSPAARDHQPPGLSERLA